MKKRGRPISKQTLLEKFTNCYTKKDNGCWEWNKGKDQGYGVFWNHIDGIKIRANRQSYLLFKGDIEIDMHVCHSCDNPPCVNPEHLFLGTAKDNYLDMMKKGRRAPNWGEYAGSSKLKEKDIHRIFQLGRLGLTQIEIAKKYKMNPCNISRILNGKRWGYLKNNFPKKVI